MTVRSDTVQACMEWSSYRVHMRLRRDSSSLFEGQSSHMLLVRPRRGGLSPPGME